MPVCLLPAPQMFAQAGQYAASFQTPLLLTRYCTQISPMMEPLRNHKVRVIIDHTCAVYKHLHTILVYSNLLNTLTIIYFPLKCPWSQKGFSERHEIWFWILAGKRRGNIKIFTKYLTFWYFLPNQELLNKKFPEVSKTLSQLNVTKHPYFEIYLNFKIF